MKADDDMSIFYFCFFVNLINSAFTYTYICIFFFLFWIRKIDLDCVSFPSIPMQILFFFFLFCNTLSRILAMPRAARVRSYNRPKFPQLPGFLPGGRKRRCNARMQAQRRPRDCPTAQSCDADACHVQIPEEGQTDESTTLDGRGGVGQPHPRAGARGCKILRVRLLALVNSQFIPFGRRNNRG